MQAYGPTFARVYNEKWVDFARHVAPLIRTFYESTPVGQQDRSLLDLCCGTGQLAQHFLEHGYRVTGIDLSEYMLTYARQNNAPYIERGQASFLQADAADFTLDEQFGLIVSTFDALNHLPDDGALCGCFASVYPLLLPQGVFIFDLNTRTGLTRWNAINVRDMPDHMIVDRGIYDGQGNRAWVKITGFGLQHRLRSRLGARHAVPDRLAKRLLCPHRRPGPADPRSRGREPGVRDRRQIGRHSHRSIALVLLTR
jgi:SAM-dependent methyltransferase